MFSPPVNPIAAVHDEDLAVVPQVHPQPVERVEERQERGRPARPRRVSSRSSRDGRLYDPTESYRNRTSTPRLAQLAQRVDEPPAGVVRAEDEELDVDVVLRRTRSPRAWRRTPVAPSW